MIALLKLYGGDVSTVAMLMQTALRGKWITPEQSAARAREIAAMPPGPDKHRCFDVLVNEIARQHGHGEAVDLFEQHAAPEHHVAGNRQHSTCCQALMLMFFAVLNNDPEAEAQSRAAAARCEGVCKA